MDIIDTVCTKVDNKLKADYMLQEVRRLRSIVNDSLFTKSIVGHLESVDQLQPIITLNHIPMKIS